MVEPNIPPESLQLPVGEPRCSFFVPLNEKGTLPRVEGPEHRKSIILMASVTDIFLELQKRVATDSLTGLPNREAFANELAKRTSVAKEDDEFAIMFIDLDQFKQVNDTYGHEKGDTLLRSVADKLQIQLREGEFVARLGGDEFVAIVNPHNDTGGSSRDERLGPHEVIEGLKHRLVSEVEAVAEEVGAPFVGASIGVAYFVMGETPVELLNRADEQMYIVKQESGAGR